MYAGIFFSAVLCVLCGFSVCLRTVCGYQQRGNGQGMRETGAETRLCICPSALSLCHDNNLTRETVYKFQKTRDAILWYIYIPDRLKTSCAPSVRQESR